MIENELYPWIFFNLFIVGMLLLDLLFFHRKSEVVSIKEGVLWTLFWIFLALLFNIYIYKQRGIEDALNFFTGYLIEKSLSIDNLFVFLLIFKYFQPPKHAIHKVLFWGVFGAIIFRALFIWFGVVLVTNFHWILYVFGLFLVLTGVKLWLKKEEEIHPERNIFLKGFRYFFSVTDQYEGDKFFVLKGVTYYATPLFIVLLTVEMTDIIFAVDSIPAIFAVTLDPFIVYTSNIFAILGLRSLFFVLSHVMSLFHYLHYGLALILIFIGTKMLISDYFKISVVFTFIFVFFILSFSVFLSLIFPVKESKDR